MEKKLQIEESNLLPWIKSGEYRSPEYQSNIADIQRRISQPDTEEIFFYPKNKSVI